MIEIYDEQNNYLGRMPSIRSASAFTRTDRRIVTQQINRPKTGCIKYYTADERGTLLRLVHELQELAQDTPYPTQRQINSVNNALKELLS